LVDRLYRETSLYHREQRVQDIQSSINRSKAKGGGDVAQTELSLDAWNHADPDFQEPLPTWVEDENG
jgi:hypothetical protein